MTVRSGLVVGAMLLGVGCMETRRSPGEDCLKDDDCLSGVCSQFHCTTRPATVDVLISADGASANAPSDAASPQADAVGDDAQADGSSADASTDDERSGD